MPFAPNFRFQDIFMYGIKGLVSFLRYYIGRQGMTVLKFWGPGNFELFVLASSIPQSRSLILIGAYAQLTRVFRT